jgi:hypothetical protein
VNDDQSEIDEPQLVGAFEWARMQQDTENNRVLGGCAFGLAFLAFVLAFVCVILWACRG